MNKSGHKLVVWDAATRLFHWVTLVLVIAAYWTWRMNWMDWHACTGDAVLALVVFRVLWGFFGSETARFSTFVAAPSRARSLGRPQPSRWLDGSTPARVIARGGANGPVCEQRRGK